MPPSYELNSPGFDNSTPGYAPMRYWVRPAPFVRIKARAMPTEFVSKDLNCMNPFLSKCLQVLHQMMNSYCWIPLGYTTNMPSEKTISLLKFEVTVPIR
jgi:hypothetical protein